MAGVLAIRVWMAPYVAFSYQDSGGLQATPIVGSLQAVADSQPSRISSGSKAISTK